VHELYIFVLTLLNSTGKRKWKTKINTLVVIEDFEMENVTINFLQIYAAVYMSATLQKMDEKN
jgi:hypothetical protein